MKAFVWYWYPLWGKTEIAPKDRTEVEVTMELLTELIENFDVMLRKTDDPRSKKQKANNEPTWTPTLYLFLDQKGGRFRQR